MVCQIDNHSEEVFTSTTHSHHPYILCHFANYFLCLLVMCMGGLWKVVGRVLLYVVHVDVHGVCCVVGGCNVVATDHCRYCLSCMQKL